MSVTATRIPSATWAVDPVHSSAEFAVKHMVVSTFRGTFAQIDASLVTGEDGHKLVGSVPVESVEVKLEDLKGHLLGPDFFDAANTPAVGFESASFDVADDGTVTLEGDLSIKGHTERVGATGVLNYIEADLGGGERIGLELDTIVDRTKFGLNWNAPLPKGGFALANDVKLSIHLELTKAEA